MKYNFNNISITSKEHLNQYVSDEDIMWYYFGEFKLNTYYNSPLRNESKPSFMITYYKSELKWRDFGMFDHPKNAVEFVMLHPEIPVSNYFDALNRIYTEVYLGGKMKKVAKEMKRSTKDKKVSLLYSSKFTPEELAYWEQANIDREDLRRFNVYTCQVWNNGRLYHSSKRNDPYYVYMFDKEKDIWKAYRPKTKVQSKKFFANNVANHIQGWDLLPDTGYVVFVTKSYKDIIVLDKIGISACAPHSEVAFLSDKQIADLKKRFNYVYVNYDNDDTGIKNSKKYSSQHNIFYWNVPHIYDADDPFKLVVNYGYDELVDSITEKFERDGIDPDYIDGFKIFN